VLAVSTSVSVYGTYVLRVGKEIAQLLCSQYTDQNVATVGLCDEVLVAMVLIGAVLVLIELSLPSRRRPQ
jgi:hypothetical protein